ncbi:MAG: hypothetical protein KatS3mg114_1389 [Planctomycetaceae bacterium]|nr:MAG: hypothetical protein KatS3mg114_1389 [Planctomycetaceae bacterium]
MPLSEIELLDQLRQKFGWSLANELGRGGFSRVFKEQVHGLPRAVKIPLHPCEGKLQQVVERELTISRDAAGHPRIMGLIEYHWFDHWLVTVWEWADGGSLRHVLNQCLQQGTRIPVKQLIIWMSEAAEGIDYLNRKLGAYHRDIKPDNLLLFQNHVKLGDFGLAKLAEGFSTQSNTVAGTLGFQPPEALEHKLHPTIDLYALVATYALLRTGRHPFGRHQGEILENQRRGNFFLEGLSPAEEKLVRSVLHPDRDQRLNLRASEWVHRLVKELKQQAAQAVAQERSRSATASGASPEKKLAQPAGNMPDPVTPASKVPPAGKSSSAGSLGGTSSAQPPRRNPSMPPSASTVHPDVGPKVPGAPVVTPQSHIHTPNPGASDTKIQDVVKRPPPPPPPPPPRSSVLTHPPQTHTVYSHQSLLEVVQRARPSDIVQLQEGVFVIHTTLDLIKPLKIIGAGDHANHHPLPGTW